MYCFVTLDNMWDSTLWHVVYLNICLITNDLNLFLFFSPYIIYEHSEYHIGSVIWGYMGSVGVEAQPELEQRTFKRL